MNRLSSATIAQRQDATSTRTVTVQEVRFLIGMPFLDHAGAAHRVASERTVERLIPGFHGSIGLPSATAVRIV